MMEQNILKNTFLPADIAPTPAASPSPVNIIMNDSNESLPQSETSKILEPEKPSVDEESQEAVDIRDLIKESHDSEKLQVSGAEQSSKDGVTDKVEIEKPKSAEPHVESQRRNSGLPRPQLQAVSNVLKSLRAHSDADPFKMPVNPIADGVPEYLNVIDIPMDMFTLGKKLEDSSYETVEDFISDVRLIFSNCYKFNGLDSWISQKAKALETYFEDKLMPRLTAVRPSPSYNIAPSLKPVAEPSKVVKAGKPNISDFEYAKKIVNDFLTNKRRISYTFPFLEPVDPVKLNIPQYFDIIKTPMDLSTVLKKLEDSTYADAEEVVDDIRLMLQNCFSFNAPEHLVHKTGKAFEREFNKEWAKRPSVKEAQLAAKQASQRSHPHTRSSVSGSAPVSRKRTASEVKRSGSFGGHSRQNSIDWDINRLVSETESDDDEIEHQLRLMQQNLTLINSQLQHLLEKRFKKKKNKRSKTSRQKSSSSGLEVDSRSRKSGTSGKSKKSSHGVSSPSLHESSKKAYSSSKSKKALDVVGSEPAVAETDLPDLTYEQKAELSEGISVLEGQALLDVLAIIQQSVPNLGGAGSEEIELDVEALDKKTLWRLHSLVIGSRQPQTHRPKPSDSDSSDTESDH